LGTRLRIALYHNLPSGGAKRSLFETVRRLGQSNQIDLFAPSTADEIFCSILPYVHRSNIVPFSTGLRLRKPFGRLNNIFLLEDIARLRRLLQLFAEKINNGDYDVVLVHPSQWTQAPDLLRYLQLPSVYYCHEPLRRLYETDWIKKTVNQTTKQILISKLDPLPRIVDGYVRRIDFEAARSSTTIVTNSKFTAGEIKYVYGKEASVAYHGVDTEIFRPLGLKRENFVLSVGALLPHKGYDFVIRSLSRIPVNLRPPLIIVSNATSAVEHSRLQSLASEYEVVVDYYSQISVSDLVDLYNRCSLVIYMPYREPFGLVPLEAMACGTAVVAAREGGPGESVVDGQTGILVEHDEQKCAVVVMNLLLDGVLRERLGEQGINYVRTYWTWDKAVERMEKILYESIRSFASQPLYSFDHDEAS
jgi:glycosyltransferase involved in cell wall biosynthesis